MRYAAFILLATYSVSGCGLINPGQSEGPVATAAVATDHAVQTLEALTPSPSAVPSETPTRSTTSSSTASATETPTETPPPPIVSVSLATNCRSGPGASFSFLGVLKTGETTEVLARSTLPDYWYVVNPDQPDEYCWLWAGNATVEGEVESLPELTPAPSPRPALGFQLYLYGFGRCSDQTYVVLIVQNTGQKRLMSSNLHVYNSDADKNLHGPAFERHPFAETTTVCPPGHGNILDPGGGAYIIIPLKSSPSGDLAYAVVKLCTEDFLGGDCQTNTIYFRLPK